jgi:hypothetical protein
MKMTDEKAIYLTAEEYAKRRCTSINSLANERAMGRGPAYVKFGRAVRYPLKMVEAFERANLVIPGHVA